MTGASQTTSFVTPSDGAEDVTNLYQYFFHLTFPTDEAKLCFFKPCAN